jgi:drug/metabolite transporter (DMT)-like permease
MSKGSETEALPVHGQDSYGRERTPVAAYAILLGAQLAVGSAAIPARFSLHGAGPVVVSALRLTMAALPFLIFSWSAARRLAIPKKHELLLSLAGVALALHFATWIGSLLYTSIAASMLLVSTAPIWTALYETLILKKKTEARFWLAFLAATCGVGLVVSGGNNTAPIAGMAPTGNLLAIAGGALFAAYLIPIRSVSNTYPTTVIVGRTYSWAALVLVLLSIVLNQPPPPINDPLSWGGIVAMAIFPQMLGHTGMNASLRWFSSSTVAFSTLLEPVIAVMLAAMIFGETLSLPAVLGGLLILGALAVTLRLQPAEVQRQIAVESNEL